MSDKTFQYDVAFSFAGEQRGFVREVFNYVENSGVRVFFDEAKRTELWGENLVDYFQEVFQNNSRFCVMFISEEYKEKVWTNFERQVIEARSLIDQGYLLPARFDKTEVAGVLDTISYIDLSDMTPEEFGKVIIEKVTKRQQKGTTLEQPKISFREPKTKKTFNPYKATQEWIKSIEKELDERCKKTTSIKLELSAFDRKGTKCLRIVSLEEGKTIYSLNLDVGDMSSDHGISFYGVRGEANSSYGSHNAFGSFEWSPEVDDVVIKLSDMSFLDSYSYGRDKKYYTKEELVTVIWDRICDLIEEDNSRSY